MESFPVFVRQSGLILLLAAVQAAGASCARSASSPTLDMGASPSFRPVGTILLAEQRSTWLDLPAPPYNVAVTIKIKLDRIGYRVTVDPERPHDKVLVVKYEESPGRYYQRLEQGTKISCVLHLYEPTKRPEKPLLSYHLKAETSWPQPVSSLYWDAVQHLEENPYYYYLGELIHGRLVLGMDTVAVFSKVLREPPLIVSSAGEGPQLTARIVANEQARRRAIAELGLLKDKRALDTLWYLVAQDARLERKAAVEAIGEVGDASAIPRLTQLRSTEADPELRATMEAAITRLREKS